jgi:Zn-dependent peptidase ImmA (M78 family)
VKLPKVIHVGGIAYRIIDNEDDVLHRDAVEMGAKRGLYGVTDMKAPTIYLHSQNHVSRQREILLHELLHAINDYTGVAHLLTKDKEEDVCQRTAPALLGVMRWNPAAVDYLMAEDE